MSAEKSGFSVELLGKKSQIPIPRKGNPPAPHLGIRIGVGEKRNVNLFTVPDATRFDFYGRHSNQIIPSA